MASGSEGFTGFVGASAASATLLKSATPTPAAQTWGMNFNFMVCSELRTPNDIRKLQWPCWSVAFPPPHPGPLPQGEGGTLSAWGQVEALWICHATGDRTPSPQGRGPG